MLKTTATGNSTPSDDVNDDTPAEMEALSADGKRLRYSGKSAHVSSTDSVMDRFNPCTVDRSCSDAPDNAGSREPDIGDNAASDTFTMCITTQASTSNNRTNGCIVRTVSIRTNVKSATDPNHPRRRRLSLSFAVQFSHTRGETLSTEKKGQLTNGRGFSCLLWLLLVRYSNAPVSHSRGGGGGGDGDGQRPPKEPFV